MRRWIPLVMCMHVVAGIAGCLGGPEPEPNAGGDLQKSFTLALRNKGANAVDTFVNLTAPSGLVLIHERGQVGGGDSLVRSVAVVQEGRYVIDGWLRGTAGRGSTAFNPEFDTRNCPRESELFLELSFEETNEILGPGGIQTATSSNC